MVGLGAFIGCSVLCGLAVAPGMLIAARVLQGASAALMAPQVLAMVQVEFPRVALLFFAGTAYSLVLTVHLQSGLGYSPLRAALAMVPFTVGVGVGSLFAPRWRPLGRRLAFIGSTIIVLGLGAAAAAIDRYGLALRWWQLLPGLVIAGFGMAMVCGTLVATVLARMPRHLAGTTASLVNTNIQVGAAAGVAFIGTVYFGQSAHGPVHAAVATMVCVLGLYAASALASFALPPGRLVWAADHPPARPTSQSAETRGRPRLRL